MFVIKNIKRKYDCYISDTNVWKGLIEAKIFKSEKEAFDYLNENKIEDGKVYTWSEITSIK